MYKVKLLKNYDLEKERIFQDTAKSKPFKGKKKATWTIFKIYISFRTRHYKMASSRFEDYSNACH